MHRRISLGVIFLTVFLDLFGFGMVLPLMPLYATDPRFAATPEQIGWLMAIYSLGQFLFAPLWGRVSDRYGRRPIIILGLVGSSISYLVYGLAGTLLTLFIARGVAGIMGANIATAQAMIADITPPEKRAHGMGMIGAALGLGFVLGPAIGGLLSNYGLAAAPFAAAVVTGLNAIVAFLFLAESHPKPGGEQKKRMHPLAWSTWSAASARPAAFGVSLLMGLFITAFAAFEVTLPMWGQATFGWTISTVGWMFAYIGVLMVIVQGGVVRRLVPKIGEKKAAMLGLVLVAGGLTALGMPELNGPFWLVIIPVALGAGLVHPALSSLVSLNTDAAHQGAVLGLFQSFSALGRVVGPVAGGLLFGMGGGTVFGWSGAAVAVVLLGLVLLSKHLIDVREQKTDG